MDYSAVNKSTVFHVDPEHAGLRLSVILIFILLWMIFFALLRLVLADSVVALAGLAVSFALAALATQQAEKALKERWPSGRQLRIDSASVQLVHKDRVQSQVDPIQQVNVLMWRFKIGRRSRVRPGWYVVACALEQDQSYVAIYTFMSPDAFDALNANPHFTMLEKPKRNDEPSNPYQRQMQLAGVQRRLQVAEKVRWMEGAEMRPDDFQTYLKTLQDQFPQWMPSVL